MITFYDPRDPWGFFSNFSRHSVRVYGRTWATSEHAFQAMKYYPHRPDLVEWVRGQTSPGKAARAGRDTSKPIRKDWDDLPDLEHAARVDTIAQPDDGVYRPGVQAEPLFARTKDVIMYEVCLAKFQQHPDLRDALVGTGVQKIVEDAIGDPYWGWGASRVGENKLGRVLMAVREALRPGTQNQ